VRLEHENGLSATESGRQSPLKLPAMTKHLDVLSDAGLISRTWRGRMVSVQLVAGPMEEVTAWFGQGAMSA
jgi:DNA-binding transcriptional ArsR family regulator